MAYNQYKDNPAADPQYDRPVRIGAGTTQNGMNGTRPSTDPNDDIVRYQGQEYRRSDLLRQRPDLAQYIGNSGAAAQNQQLAQTPPNSFERAISDARTAMQNATAANEHRYGQLLTNAGKQYGLADQSFAGIGQRLTDDNAASAAANAGNLAELNRGYDEAGNQIQQVGTQALNEAHRQQASGIAGAQSGAVSRGLFGSTVLDSLKRRAQESGDRNIQGINESIAGLRSGLAERRGAAVSSFGNSIAQQASAGRLRLAQNDQNLYGARSGALQTRAGVIERRQDNAPDAGQIAALIGNREANVASAAARNNEGGSALLAALGGIGQGVATIAPLFSDKRLKKDIKPAGHKMIDGESVPVFTYKYTDAAKKSGRGIPGKFKGPMAQDVENVEPSAVAKDSDGFRMMKGKWTKKVGDGEQDPQFEKMRSKWKRKK